MSVTACWKHMDTGESATSRRILVLIKSFWNNGVNAAICVWLQLKDKEEASKANQLKTGVNHDSAKMGKILEKTENVPKTK